MPLLFRERFSMGQLEPTAGVGQPRKAARAAPDGAESAAGAPTTGAGSSDDRGEHHRRVFWRRNPSLVNQVFH